MAILKWSEASAASPGTTRAGLAQSDSSFAVVFQIALISSSLVIKRPGLVTK